MAAASSTAKAAQPITLIACVAIMELLVCGDALRPTPMKDRSA
jgi:hypothetical protein